MVGVRSSSKSSVFVSLAANNPPLRDGMARVKKAQGDLAGAIEIYRRLLRPDISATWPSGRPCSSRVMSSS